jgi:hypothetical protein
MEEFDEREFLLGIQIVSYVSNLRRLLHGQRNHLTECVLWLDGCLGGLGHGHDLVWGGGGLGQGLLQLLKLYGCRQSISFS